MVDKILTGIIITVASAIILVLIFAFFGSASPTRVVQSQNEVCPTYLSFNYENQESFQIQLKNYGKTGVMFVKLNSSNISFKTKERDIFENGKKLSWNVPAGEYQDFKFDILKDENLKGNFSIQVKYGCNGLTCIFYSFIGRKPFYCNYEGDDRTFNLVNETVQPLF